MTRAKGLGDRQSPGSRELKVRRIGEAAHRHGDANARRKPDNGTIAYGLPHEAEVELRHALQVGGVEVCKPSPTRRLQVRSGQALALFSYKCRPALRQGRRELANTGQRVDAAGAELERLAERRRTERERVRQVAMDAVAGVIV